MHYRTLLRWSLAPTLILLLISIASMALTTHYWIVGDWLTTRGIAVPNGTTDTRRRNWKITIVDYRATATDATIVSECLGLFAGIVSVIAWAKLRHPDMDMAHSRVCENLRSARHNRRSGSWAVWGKIDG